MQVSDLDGTMVGTTQEADEMTSAFTQYWEGTAALCNSVLVYNTGRSLGQFKGLLQEKAGVLAVPDVLITAVGTKVGCWGHSRKRQTLSRGLLLGDCAILGMLIQTGRSLKQSTGAPMGRGHPTRSSLMRAPTCRYLHVSDKPFGKAVAGLARRWLQQTCWLGCGQPGGSCKGSNEALCRWSCACAHVALHLRFENCELYAST